MKRILLISLGWLSVTLGVIGIFLPVLPTTPFLLLASWCFAQSSLRFHHWLMSHPNLGPIVSMWQSGQGIPRKARNRAIIAIAVGMTLSAVIVAKLWVTLMLAFTGSCVAAYLMRLPLVPESATQTETPNSPD